MTMIKIQSLRSTIIAQFLVILLPVILLSGYQILTEAQRTATVDRAFQQHRLILAASDRYAVFKNGVVDAVDTEQLSRQALTALVDSHNYLGQLGRESGSVEIIESAGKLNAIVAELSQDSGMPALLKTRDAINTTHERIVRAVKNYEEQMNAAIVRSTDDSKRKTTLVIWVSTLVLAMTVWFVFRMIRHLSQPLGLAVSVANRIADDQPVAESEFRMHSDVGNLLKSLSRMHLSLQRYRAEVEDSHNGLEDKIRQLAESQASLAEAQRLAKFGNWHWEVTSPTAYWSDELYRILGADPRTCTPVMQNFLMLVDASEREAVSIKFQSLRQTAGSSSGEHRVIGMDGVTRIVHSQCSSVEGTTGAVVRLFGTIQDITERKRAEDEIHRLALHDSLTGLPNRQFFRDQLDHALARARRSNERLAIMFLDLDRFKRINDTMGHAAGDALLKQFAERLQFCVRDADYVAREDSETSGAVARLAECHPAAAQKRQRCQLDPGIASIGTAACDRR